MLVESWASPLLPRISRWAAVFAVLRLTEDGDLAREGASEPRIKGSGSPARGIGRLNADNRPKSHCGDAGR
jgi:hypothetical protein